MAENLFATLTEYRRNRRNRVLTVAAGRWVTVNLAVTVVLLLLDNFLGIPGTGRVLLLLAWAGGNLLALPFLRRRLHAAHRTDREAAVELEKYFGIHDNAWVNAVCFRNDPAVSEALRQTFIARADAGCRRITVPGIRVDRECRRWAVVALSAIGLSLIYFLPFARYADNAWQRYLHPWSQLAALNFVQFTVEPGDATIIEGGELTVKAAAERDRQLLHNLKIIVKGDGVPVLYNMTQTDGHSIFTLKNLNAAVSYAISGGGDTSRWFRIAVKPRPRLSQINVKITPPSYTGIKPREYGAETREITAPAGSAVVLSMTSPHGTKAGIMVADDSTEKEPPYFFRLDRDLTLSAFVRDSAGVRYNDAWSCGFKMQPDRPPQVRFLNRETNLEAGPGQVIPLYFAADDDFGVTQLRVTAGSNGQTRILKEFHYDTPVPAKAREVYRLRLDPACFPLDDTVEINVTAMDNRNPVQTAVTPTPVTIHVVDPVAKLRDAADRGPGDRLYGLLFQALARQQSARDWLADRIKSFRRPDGWKVLEDQKFVDETLSQAELAAATLQRKNKLSSRFTSAITAIIRQYAAPLRVHVRNMTTDKNAVNLPLELNNVMLTQTRLIEALQELLGGLAMDREQELRRREGMRDEAREKAFYERLEQMRKKMDRFLKEQQKIITQTEAYDPKKADDWSEREEKLLGDMAVREAEWAQFFKATFNDLSKTMNQDFSNSAMADEFTEMYEELQKAGAALERKKIEIATLAEDTACSSAKTVAANLDRWLSDYKDYIKWNAEEDGKAPDVKLTDLPEELTDIIGDLVENESDMNEDTQDSTNSFSYDTDVGIGWGVSDGNINSMQAKGITGNVLPNNNEVGGRSGEGRSGKSSGQFVEKTATGKGGRKTPTRLVQSAFEKGTVDDTSKDPQGGASGGGKQSGIGGEGLAGTTPDQDPDIKQRLNGDQGELKQRVEVLLRRLNDHQLPTGDLREALSRLRQLDGGGMAIGSGVDPRRVRSEALAALRQARTAIDTAIRSDQEQLKTNHRKAFTVKSQSNEKVPAEYDDMVGRYFKAMAAEEE